MSVSPPIPLSLTILADVGTLHFSLTDGRSIARAASIAFHPEPAAHFDDPQARPAGLRRLGADLCQRYLPSPVLAFLRDSPVRELRLLIDQRAAAVPWELVFDGAGFLCERFAVVRHIVSDAELPAPRRATPGPQALQVLLLVDAPALARRSERLLARLQRIDDVRASCRDANALAPGELAGLLVAHSVVHRIGASLADLVLPAGPVNGPDLLIADTGTRISRDGQQGSALAERACRAGLTLLLLEGLSEADEGGFVATLHRLLAQGTPIGESVRQAKALAASTGTGDLGAILASTLYGASDNALRAARPSLPHEDSLRQLTAMSCDLVGSTQLMNALGPESYSERLEAFHRVCVDVVSEHGGVADDPQGDDGVMCYFGFPSAREDSVAHALRAGLAVLDAMVVLGLEVRVGMSTGPVVVKSGQPVGAAVHLAARLQSIAAPGTLLASASTRAIARDRFVFRQLDSVPPLKGFDEPGAVHRVLGEAGARGVQSLQAPPAPSTFIGRDSETATLAAQWRAAAAGALGMVLISGDAGIGKSRLVREFKLSPALAGARSIEVRCTPDHVNSAFHPVIEYLRGLLQLGDADAIDAKLQKIAANLLPGAGSAATVALIAALLSIPVGPDPHADVPAERRRELTLDALVAWLIGASIETPLCLIVEDVHWIDPSTRDLLNRLLAEHADARLLVLITARSPLERQGAAVDMPAHAVEIELRGLSPEAATLLIGHASGPVTLSGAMVRAIVAKADGVPLFIEESARMAVDLGVDAGAPGSASVVQLAVPSTIQDLLMARLDRLGPAKQVAQTGASIGREFTLPLLAATLAHPGSPIRIDHLEARLAELLGSGLLIRKDVQRYAFKHALVRDAAYQSLWERDRRHLHRCIALVMPEQFAELAESQPELLAHHCTQAGMAAQALVHWERAARRAASRSAHLEAINHVQNALQLLASAAIPEAHRIELRLQLMLAGQLIATQGYGADEVERVYARALALCRQSGDVAALIKVELGLEGYYFMRADFAKASVIVDRATLLAERTGDPIGRLQSLWAAGNIRFHQGDIGGAIECMDRCVSGFSTATRRPGMVQDPAVMSLCYSSWGQWERGFPDDALARAQRAVELAQRLEHRFSMAEAQGFRCAVHHFRGEDEIALGFAERAIEVSTAGGFAVWLAHATLMRGRIRASLGDAEGGVAEMRVGYQMWAATGAVVTRPFYLALQAEGIALAGRVDEALALAHEALALVAQYGERYYEPELMRLVADLGRRAGVVGEEAAESALRHALACAQRQGLRTFVLRCATSLAQLLASAARDGEARRILKSAHDAINEGRDTRDLRMAQALLASLQPRRPENSSVEQR